MQQGLKKQKDKLKKTKAGCEQNDRHLCKDKAASAQQLELLAERARELRQASRHIGND